MDATGRSVPQPFAQESHRRESVLVLRGTGLNFWHYLPFLGAFRLEELAQFRAVYSVSGASLLVWLYSRIPEGAKLGSSAAAYDHAMRSCLNRYGWIRRTARMIAGRYPYRAEDFLCVFDRLTEPGAWRQTLGQVSLPNWQIVAHEEEKKELLVMGPRASPDFLVGEVISRAVTWSEMFHRPFCYRSRYGGLRIGDFDFASRRVHAEFREHLRSRYPGAPIYHVNLFHTAERGAVRFVRVGSGRLTRLWQVLDFTAFYLGIPNRRYVAAAGKCMGGPV